MRLKLPTLRGWHIALLAVSTAACTAGAGGGAFGAIFAAVMVAVALLAACSGGPDKNNGDSNVQACLSMKLEDMGSGDNDVNIGPCLTQIPPDMGLDSGPDPVDIGPCLQPPPPDFGTDDGSSADMIEMGALPTRDRDEILARLQDRLPDDVAARLSDDNENA